MKTEETAANKTRESTLLPAIANAASKPLWAVIIIAASSFVLFGYSLWYPLGRDQSIFAYIADRMADGGIPYKDAWDFKSPGIYYIYRLAFMLFGRAELSVRIIDMLAALATSFLLWHIFYRRKLGTVGVATGILYAALYGLSGYWCLAQTEGFGAFFTALAIHQVLSPSWNRTGRLIIVGLALGAAFLMKFSFLLVGLALIVFAILSAENKSRLRIAFTMLLSFSVIPAVVAIYFASHGALSDALAASVWFAGKYRSFPPKAASDVVLDFVIAGFGRKTVYDVLILPLSILGILFASGELKREQSAARFLFFSSIAAIASQLKFFPYHWVAMFVPLSILAGLTLSSVENTKTSDGRISRGFVVIVASLLILRALLASVTEWGLLLAPTPPGGVSPWAAQFSTAQGQGISYVSDVAVADYVKQNTLPRDTVLVMGFEPLINFLSQRPSPTRFVYMDAVTAPWSPDEWKQEYLDDITSSRPAMIIVAHDDTHIWRNRDSASLLKDWPELQAFVRMNYRLAGSVGVFDVLTKAESGGGSNQ